MAYPTNVSFQPVGTTLGAQLIEEASSTARRPTGATQRAKSLVYGEAVFTYLQALTANTQGQCCAYNAASGHSAPVSAISKGPVGIAMSDLAIGQYGWFCTEGAVPCASGTIVANSLAYPTSVNGTLDDSDVNSLGLVLTGAKWVTADSGGFATINVSSPSISSTVGGGGGGGVTTLGDVGGTANAKGGAIVGTTYTQALASTSFPGAMSAADKTSLNALVAEAIERFPKTEHYSPTTTSVTGTTSPTVAGDCFLMRIQIRKSCKIDQISVLNGTAPGGNCYVGIYGPSVTQDCSVGAPLVATSASTSMAGTGANGVPATSNHMFAIALTTTPQLVAGGQYWIAFHLDGVNVNYFRHQNLRASSGLTNNITGTGCTQRFNQTFGALPGTVPTLSAGGGNDTNNFPVLEIRCIP